MKTSAQLCRMFTLSRTFSLLGTCLFLCCSTAWAHKASDSYLTLRLTPAGLTGEWHLALRDLDYAIGLDANDDGAITWQELRSQQSAIEAYALARLEIAASGNKARLHLTPFLVDNHSDGAYAVLRFAVEGLSGLTALDVRYRALFEVDPLHRGLLRLELPDASRLAVFGPDSTLQHFEIGGHSPTHASLAFVEEGIWHIWTGYDHILFLLALLLPAMLLRPDRGWEPRVALRPGIVEVLKTVTAFTVAHSITLSLAAFGVVHLPPRWVESAIAASIIFAALNNLRPIIAGKAWMVAFTFGLIHGFGFANALADLGVRGANLAMVLFEFNAGVEIGQLVIVGLFLPLALLLRNRPLYRTHLLPVGSTAIAAVAAVWFFERVLDAKWLPF